MMGTRFVAVMLLVTLVGGSRVDRLPDDLSFIESLIEPYEDCKFGTLSCSEKCESVQICLGGGQYEVVEDCAAGSMCDARNNSCVAGLTTCNAVDPDIFTCHGPVGGNFPNPGDCHSYFVCPDPSTSTSTTTSSTTKKPFLSEDLRAVSGEKRNCTGTTAYDALSGTCRFNSNHRVCTDRPVPKCTEEMQAGALIENPNIFFVCVKVNGVLQTWLAKCPLPTDVFVDNACVDADSTSTSASGPTTTAATDPTSSVTTPTSPTTATSSETTPTSPTTVTSSETTPTSPTTATSSETTPTSPTTATSSVTTPTSPTTATSPETTTRNYCTNPGTTIPDPTNCHGYFLCTMDLDQIPFVCQQGYHYDKVLHRCVKGSC